MDTRTDVLILDLKPYIDFFSRNEEMYWLYKRIPLPIIVRHMVGFYFDLLIEDCAETMLLQTHQDWLSRGNMPVYDVYESNDHLDDINDQLLDFYACMVGVLDEYLYMKGKYDINAVRFKLAQWLDNTSIVLIKHSNRVV